LSIRQAFFRGALIKDILNFSARAPSLSIVTPIYNGAKTLNVYLGSVYGSLYRDFELIIVDGLSEDRSEQICKGYKLRYEQLGRRCDSANKRNKGLEMAQAELVLFLDADIVIPPTALGDIMGIFKDHPEIAGLIGSYDDDPGGRNMTSQFKFLFHHYTHQQEGRYIDSFWSGCGAIRKNVFNSLGGFNAPFLHGGSVHDIEFGYRLKRGGYKIYNAKEIQVKHLKELDLWEWIYTDICVRGVPWIIIMLTYKDFSLKLNANRTGIISTLCAWGLVVMLGASVWGGIFIDGAGACLAIFLAVNWKMLDFFRMKKDFLFSSLCVFYLLVYYFNCGICALAGPIYYARIPHKRY